MATTILQQRTFVHVCCTFANVCLFMVAVKEKMQLFASGVNADE